jgi:muramoyltetrapeptide carboxypeptidase
MKLDVMTVLQHAVFSVALTGVLLSNLVSIAIGQQHQAMVPWIKPKALRPGDTVAIVAPSSPVDVNQIRAYAQRLQESGYQVLIPEDIGRKSGYLAGNDQQRAEELNAMIRNPVVRAIFPARGGYGLTRILDRLDYDALRRDPKIITGYSDITALHLAIARKCQMVTFHSPVPMSDLWQGSQPAYEYADGLFTRAVFAASYSQQKGYVISAPPNRPAQTMVKGVARGRLMGGNFTLISSTLGTPMAIDATDSILFLEDVDEAPYRIDRMLSQLQLAGILDQVRGVILGDFSHQQGETQDEMQRVLHDYFENAPYPVLSHFPVGHIATNATLPIGAIAQLDADAATITLLENPVELPQP